MSRIEQLIGEIEEYIDSCKFQPLSTTKIIVNKDQIDELLRELRMKTPDEIKRYQKIISNLLYALAPLVFSGYEINSPFFQSLFPSNFPSIFPSFFPSNLPMH